MDIDVDALEIVAINREELDLAVSWAAAEGWNPGLHDADIFWQTDPEGFLGIKHAGELIATGSVVAYGTAYGFMGFFIVKSELRGQKIGTKLWLHRRDWLKSRLGVGAAIGMDGVFDMQSWYARGGFVFSHRNLRMEGLARSGPVSEALVPLSEVSFEEVAAYDERHFPCARERFLKQWIAPKDGVALGYRHAGRLCGYGVIRQCLSGYKIGPLFADDTEVAEALFVGLSESAVGETIVLDIPENNPAAVALAEWHGLLDVFGCARMYYGPAPELPWANIYGITTFELG